MKTGLVFVCVIQYRLPLLYAAHMYQKISGTSGKNFHEMNGNVGMAGWE